MTAPPSPNSASSVRLKFCLDESGAVMTNACCEFERRESPWMTARANAEYGSTIFNYFDGEALWMPANAVV